MAASFKLLPERREPPKEPRPAPIPVASAPFPRKAGKSCGANIPPSIAPATGRMVLSMLASGSPVSGLTGNPCW